MPIMAKSASVTAQQRWTGLGCSTGCCDSCVFFVQERKACAMMPWSNVVLLCNNIIYIYIYIYTIWLFDIAMENPHF